MAGRHTWETIKDDNRTTIITAMFILLAALIAAGGILAKYRSERIQEAEMIALDFHISSNYLEEKSKSYTLTEWADGIAIELYNYEKENVELVSATDISYLVVADGFSVVVKNGEEIVSPGIDGYVLKKSAGKEKHTIYLTPLNAENLMGKEVTVQVTSNIPFSKTLEAKFKLDTKPGFEYDVKRVKDNGDYYEMTIYTNQFSGKLMIKWPSVLLPDNNNIVMRDWTTGAVGTYSEFKKMTTYRLIFFNPTEGATTEKDFTAGDFSVESAS